MKFWLRLHQIFHKETREERALRLAKKFNDAFDRVYGKKDNQK